MMAIEDSSPGRWRLALWLVTSLLTGAVIMSLELAAFRLYAPHFGYSIYVWGSMISVVMLALAAGYGMGGWLADRCKTDMPLYLAIILSGLYQFLTTCFARPLLSSLTQWGDFAGTSLATLLIFAPTMLSLSFVSPFIIRFLARTRHVGASAGTVYSLSTLGSVAGILATTFYLVPRLGTQRTLLVSCAVCGLVGMLGLLTRWRGAMLVLVPAVALPLSPQPLWAENALWVKESAYNLVRVKRQDDRLSLQLNDEISTHTVVDNKGLWTGHYYDYFALGPLLVHARRALVLGMGAGGSIGPTRAAAPDLQIDAVEIDEKVVEAGIRFFGIPADADWLRVYIADARPWLARSEEKYDLIQLDVYQGGPYIPFYLATVDFFRLALAHLSEDGLMIMNLYDAAGSRELLAAMVATLSRVFPTVLVLPIKQSNYMIFTFARERSITSIREHLNATHKDAAIKPLAQNAARNLFEMNLPDDGLFFTDDHAPIEDITRRMMGPARHASRASY